MFKFKSETEYVNMNDTLFKTPSPNLKQTIIFKICFIVKMMQS